MGVQSLNLYCHKCQAETGHTKATTSHGFHLLVSILTAGLWLIPWLLLGMFSSQAPKCSHCGSSYSQRLAVEARSRAQAPRPMGLPPAPSGGGMKRCPYCAEEVRAEAIKCKHCGSGLEQTFR